MPVESWLTDTLEIQRHLVNAYFIVMAFIALFAVYLAWRTRFKWLSLYLWLIAGIIGLIWEAILFGVGSRQYTLFAVGELLYHALTEGGPGLIITVLFAHWVGIIDIMRYRDPEPPAPEGGPVEGDDGDHAGNIEDEQAEEPELDAGEVA